MKENKGKIPPEAVDKRVHVVLYGGYATKEREPTGWAADGKGGCHWTIRNPPDEWDIRPWEIAG